MEMWNILLYDSVHVHRFFSIELFIIIQLFLEVQNLERIIHGHL